MDNRIYDYVQAFRDLCPETKGWLRLSCEHGNFRYIPIVCKRWDCVVCSARKLAKVRARLLTAMADKQWVAFLTLTFPADVDSATAHRRLGSLIKWVRSIDGQRVEYAAIKERTKRGRLHLHLLVLNWVWVDWASLSKAWEVRTGAWSVDIQRIRAGKRAVAYVVKYLLKGLDTESLKRITYSAGFPKLAPLGEGARAVGAYELEYLTAMTRELVANLQEALNGDTIYSGAPCFCFDSGRNLPENVVGSG
jgi:hypothetical protein